LAHRLQKQLGAAGDVGFKQAMQLKWVGIDKSGGEPRVVRKAAAIQDRVHEVLAALAAGQPAGASDAELAALRKRKLLVAEAWKTYRVGKGPAFALQRKKAATELTAEMLQKWVGGGELWGDWLQLARCCFAPPLAALHHQPFLKHSSTSYVPLWPACCRGTWREETFKAYNFDALGITPAGGHLHPLLKASAPPGPCAPSHGQLPPPSPGTCRFVMASVEGNVVPSHRAELCRRPRRRLQVRTQFRKIFTQMGFEEMPTNNYVESSFWNFDALFQPQQHPARDAHDTFFLTSELTVNGEGGGGRRCGWIVMRG
jgi:phenylalanyl-tRNA synthetase alpha chain